MMGYVSQAIAAHPMAPGRLGALRKFKRRVRRHFNHIEPIPSVRSRPRPHGRHIRVSGVVWGHYKWRNTGRRGTVCDVTPRGTQTCTLALRTIWTGKPCHPHHGNTIFFMGKVLKRVG